MKENGWKTNHMAKVSNIMKMDLNIKDNLQQVLSKVKNLHILGQMVKYTLDHLNKVLCKAMVY